MARDNEFVVPAGVGLTTFERVMSVVPKAAHDANVRPTCIAGRYRVQRELGRGGMAAVYCVFDDATQREMALKQLLLSASARSNALLLALFEREFHVLKELAHPRVIQVHDFGLDAAGPYYTMELLDGSDLRERAPLPWREACVVLFDVCSSLALLHSRRLVHRDVSPRNIRCIHAGHAKLIDFGAMTPMGRSSRVVGTPGFIAPEAQNRSELDGRTDLYSLGATLYYALTGGAPKPDLPGNGPDRPWNAAPRAPSQLVAGIPAQLDALVLSLLSIEPALRPRGAFEVMQRLSAIADLEYAEPVSVTHAYLATPSLIARDEPLAIFRKAMRRAARRRGGGLLIEAAAGLGRTRLLDSCVLEAKKLGATVLHAGGKAAAKLRFGIACSLGEQLLQQHADLAQRAAAELGLTEVLFAAAGQAAPQLDPARFAHGDRERIAAQHAFARWLLRVAEEQPLMIAVDDVDQIDSPSLAVLGAVTRRARRHRLLVAMTAERSSVPRSSALEALASLVTELTLAPLDRAETEALLSSIFGEVPHVMLLSARLHALCSGRPRDCMALVRELVDRGVIRYAAGTWTLPAELSPEDLPSSMEELCAKRVATLSTLARALAESMALAPDAAFAYPDLEWLAARAAPGKRIEQPLEELITAEVVASDGGVLALAHAGFRAALIDEIDAGARVERCRTLAELFERSERSTYVCVKYLLAAELPERALNRLCPLLRDSSDVSVLTGRSHVDVVEVGHTLARALSAAETLERPARELADLRRWVVAASIASGEHLYFQAAPPLLQQLERDAGLVFLRQMSEPQDPLQRVIKALQQAGEVYARTPESERVYSVEEAIKQLALFVAVSIAIGSRCFDARLTRSLAPLLQPLAPLSPILQAMCENALGLEESTFKRQPERARQRWMRIYERLATPECAQLPSVEVIRNAIAYAIGLTEGQFGLASQTDWAAIIDRDPMQRVNAMLLRRLFALHRGDLDAANRFTRQAELLELESTTGQMFTNIFAVELQVHGPAGDLTAVKRILDRIIPLAERHHGWAAYRWLGEAQLQRLRGDLEAARAACEQALALATPDSLDPDRSIAAYPSSAGLLTELLVELGRPREAREFAERALARCRELEIDLAACDLVRALGVAEAAACDYAQGAARLEALIEAQQRFGMSGLLLGMSYEARARIAIWSGDRAAVTHFGGAAAREYRYGRGSPLGSRYERLLQESRRAGVDGLPTLADVERDAPGASKYDALRANANAMVREAFTATSDARARAECALALLCDAHGASGGHLYLMRDTALELTASVNAQAPDAGLPGLAGAFLRQHVEQNTQEVTRITAGTSPSAHWTDHTGSAYSLLLVTTGPDQASLRVGIAALRSDPLRKPHPNAFHVTCAVAACLLQAGDARAAVR